VVQNSKKTKKQMRNKLENQMRKKLVLILSATIDSSLENLSKLSLRNINHQIQAAISSTSLSTDSSTL